MDEVGGTHRRVTTRRVTTMPCALPTPRGLELMSSRAVGREWECVLGSRDATYPTDDRAQPQAGVMGVTDVSCGVSWLVLRLSYKFRFLAF